MDASAESNAAPPVGPLPDVKPPQAVEGTGLGLVLTLGFVLLADVLFYEQPLGWTVGLYGALLLAVLVWRQPQAVAGRPGRFAAKALVVLLLTFIEQPTMLAACMGILGLASLGMIGREGWLVRGSAWLQRWGAFCFMGWIAAPRDAVKFAASGKGGKLLRFLGRLAQNWTLPLGLGAAFVALFAWANPVISNWFDRFFRWLDETFALPDAGRVVFWALVGLGVWAVLRFRSGVAGPPPDPLPPEPVTGAPAFLLRSLLLFNAIFAVQTGMDAVYLLGGAALPKHLTYAQYAHRGAYPLVLAALLAALFVLGCYERDAEEAAMRWPRRLVYVWLAQNVFLVFTAAWRLWLYVQAYTLSRWRVAAAVWMLLVGMGLVWILVHIAARRSGAWLVNVNVVTALAVLYACCFVNFDGYIARFNADHCREVGGQGPNLDHGYMLRLGPDALPGLVRLHVRLEEGEARARVRHYIQCLRRRLMADLANWRGWTWRRHRLTELPFPEDPPRPAPAP